MITILVVQTRIAREYLRVPIRRLVISAHWNEKKHDLPGGYERKRLSCHTENPREGVQVA